MISHSVPSLDPSTKIYIYKKKKKKGKKNRTESNVDTEIFDRGTNPLAPDAVDLTQLTSVSEWLASIKMSRYAESFERSGVTTLEAAARVTVQELTALGVTLVGHQKKIMNSVTALRAQMSATSQGFLV